MQVPQVNAIYRVTVSEIRSVIDQRAQITIEHSNNIGMAWWTERAIETNNYNHLIKIVFTNEANSSSVRQTETNYS